MTDTFIPPEFDYTLPPQPKAVIKSRVENVVMNTNTYDTSTNKIIEFQIFNDSILDPASFNLYWDMQSTLTASTNSNTAAYYFPGAALTPTTGIVGSGVNPFVVTGTDSAAYDTKYTMCSSWELAYSIIISTGNGQIIENIQNAALLGRFISRTTAPAWNNTVLSFSNSNHNPLDNNNCNGAYYTYKIQLLELCGFFNQPKYLNLGLMGGSLKVSIQLESPNHIYTTHTTADTAALAIKNARLTYDVINASDSILEGMRQLSLSGFSFVFNTWNYTSLQVPSLANQRYTLPAANISRCKCIVMALRNITARDSYAYDSCAVLSDSSKFAGGSYYVEIGGQRYGSYIGIDSVPRAYEQIIKSTYLKKHSQCAMYDYYSAVNDWGHTNSSGIPTAAISATTLSGWSTAADLTTLKTALGTATYTSTVSQKIPDRKRVSGNNFMVIDLEKMGSTSESGVALDQNVIIGLNFPNAGTYVGTTPGTNQYVADIGASNNQTILDVFYCYEAVCHVLPGGSIKIDT